MSAGARTFVAAALAASAALAAAGAGHAELAVQAGPAAKRPSKPPTRLWYRITAEVEQKREGGLTGLGGPYNPTPVTSQHRATATYTVRSRTAVLLYRQCVSLALLTDATDPKLIAKVVTATRTTVSCAETRAYLRRLGVRPRELRRLRLVEDVRFTANGTGVLTEFERRTDVPAHTYTPTVAWYTGGRITCPATIWQVLRITELPLRIAGSLRTASVVRDGVAVSFGFPSRRIDVESGSEGGPCVTEKGVTVLMPRLVRARGVFTTGALSIRTQYGFFPASSTKARFKIGARFGRAFGVVSRQTLAEPQQSWQTEPWVTTLSTKLRFTPCPRGGRDVRAC